MGAAGVAFASPLVAATVAAEKAKPAISFFIRPLPGKNYSPSFLKFCQRMKFSSAREAVGKVKDRSVGYLLVAQPA